MIGVVGEIFCRLNTFSNNDLVRRLEEFGAEVWLNDIAEWIWYVNDDQLQRMQLQGTSFSLGAFDARLRNHFEHKDEHALLSVFQQDFRGYEEPDIRETLTLAERYLPPLGANGEMVVNIGKAVYLANQGADGVIDISPFTCMNGIVCEAIYPRVSADHGGIPIRNHYFDGTRSDLERDIGIFLELALLQTQQSGAAHPSEFPVRRSPPTLCCGTIFWMSQSADAIWIVEQAKGLGFDLCGVARADKFPELENTPDWLARGYAGEMKYLFDPRREDPRRAMPGVQSAIVCLLNYNSEHPFSTDAKFARRNGEARGWVSRYAWGDDYHSVLGERLEALNALLRERFSEPFEARVYVDTGPVQERVLAKYAGLGWLGKNTLLLNQTLGSYFFLGVILTTLDLEPTLGEKELPPPDLCGSCRQCLDACPTQAFVEPYVLDARKCISYLTIELRGSVPEELREPIGNHVFGCDICQDVCPWNRRAALSPLMQFQPRSLPSRQENATEASPDSQDDSLLLPRLERLLALDGENFRDFFRRSPIKRAKWRGLVRNACIAAGNSGMGPGSAGYARILDCLNRLAACGDSIVAESAQWALSRIQ